MSLKKLHRLRQTLAFRLTLWYAAIFSISAFSALFIFYILLNSVIRERTDRVLLKEFQEFSSLLGVKGVSELKTALDLESEAEGVDRMFFRILDEKGEVVGSSNISSWGKIGINQTSLEQLTYGKDHAFDTMMLQNRSKVRVLYSMISPGLTLQVGQSLEDETKFMDFFRNTSTEIILALIFFAAMTGWFMARRALRGVEEVTKTARQISKGAFEKRVPMKSRGYEIERLAITFNEMLDRIDTLVGGMREMTDNIAHDLRSPLSRIRGMAEMRLTTGDPSDECEAMAASTIEECDLLLEMINTMLDIAEVEAGSVRLKRDDVDMARVLREACDLFQPTAEDKDLHILSEIPKHYWISGEVQSLQRMVANLLDNAVKYTPLGGTITVSLKGNAGETIISFKDTGIGISKGDLPKIFKRFYRCDKSRSEGGIGLGLSLVEAIAKVHGGNVTATSSPGLGSTFTVSLPKIILA